MKILSSRTTFLFAKACTCRHFMRNLHQNMERTFLVLSISISSGLSALGQQQQRGLYSPEILQEIAFEHPAVTSP